MSNAAKRNLDSQFAKNQTPAGGGMAKTKQQTLKILLVGSFGVGKTNVLRVLLNKKGFDEASPPTLNPEFASLRFPHPDGEGKTIPVTLWDTAGQERYMAITNSHYRRADGALLVFSVTDRHSFQRLPNWLKELRDHAGDTLSCVMVMENKIDLMEGAQKDDPDLVNEEEVENFCQQNALMYARVTAKCNHSTTTPPSRWGGEPVQEAIQKVVERIHSRQIGQSELNKLRGNKILSAPPIVPTTKMNQQKAEKPPCC